MVLQKKNVTDRIMLYKNTKAIFSSPDGDTDLLILLLNLCIIHVHNLFRLLYTVPMNNAHE